MTELTPGFYGHSKEGMPESGWQPLEDHLVNAARISEGFAKDFSAGEWGRLAGLWHDLGKYSTEFQNRLHGDAAPVDHSTPGAVYVEKQIRLGRILSYVIAGHHTGLPDWQSEDSGSTGLAQRLQQVPSPARILLSKVPLTISNPVVPTQKPQPGTDAAFWIRMLFSCLVDADYLDTEAFMDAERSSNRTGYPPLVELLPLFTTYMAGLTASSRKTPVNDLRRNIFNQCLVRSSDPPGIFTLTVPTGGGKTLSSMAFALHHALKYHKKRIIYVIPYTSIIEQTADQFRKIFGEAVVEHHSNLDVPGIKTDLFDKHLLASENWDAPVIVTTSVQFFESLFASSPGRCRKLHNIVDSVVILDEAQLLPPDFLNPILKAIRELQRNYGVTLVLATATQPALSPHKSFDFNFEGLPETTEIIREPQKLYIALKRVEVEVPADLEKPQEWEDVARALIRHPSVLCIVNRRDDARKLFQLMPDGTIHLSALMCGAHRSEVIQRIKDSLKSDFPTTVISTQLVEAGVDIDFPVVYRALSGLDSLAQAAGRCNREGKLDKGQVVVFVPPTEPPVGHLRQAAEIGRRILAKEAGDPLALSNFEQFFRELYWLKGEKLDARGILKDLAYDPQLRFSFRTAAAKFQFIDDTRQSSVIVRYGKGSELIASLSRTGPERGLLRKLQRYVVNMPVYIHSRLLGEQRISELCPGIFVQEDAGLYSPVLGLCPDSPLVY